MKLSRKEKVEYLLDSLTKEKIEVYNNVNFGFDTNYLSNKLDMHRSNVSKELNCLVQEKKALKVKGKPVLYLGKKAIEDKFFTKLSTEEYDSLDDLQSSILGKKEIEEEKIKREGPFNLIGYNGSLKGAIEKAKAAIIYPPKGLNVLITGSTGVGKSTFAECMYKYSIETGILKKDAAFIVFNCADYSDNPNLLLSQLFGYVKGAFTGANKDKYGLVQEANNGILFLDEVHRLPAEGQEMLFLLMDKGIYRRLGEAKETNKSNVLIIAATTEEPEKVLLDTFRRRIPVVINLPDLSHRSLRERMELIYYFFQKESERINLPLKVSKEVIKAFILYECGGNVGQLKSDIQLICARGLLDCMTYKKNYVHIKLSLLSNNVREGLFSINSNRKEIINNFSLLGNDDICFYGKGSQKDVRDILIIDNKYDLDFYDIIKQSWEKLKNDGLEETQIRKILDQDIERYYHGLMNTLSQEKGETVVNHIVNPRIVEIIESAFIHNGLNKKENIILAISLHVQHLVERLKFDNVIKHPNKEEIKLERSFEYKIAEEILKKVSKEFYVEYSEDESAFLATFLHLSLTREKAKKVAVLVIMHGESTASSMAAVANNLLGVEHAVAIDMPLDEKVQTVLNKAIKTAKAIDEGKGILILTDMGSILSFAGIITESTGIETRAISMCSTPIVIEVTRKALNPEYTLEGLYNNICEVMSKYRNEDNTNIIAKQEPRRYFETILIDNMNKTLTFLNAEKTFIILKKVLNKIALHYSLVINDDLLVKFIFHCSCMIERAILKDELVYKNYDNRINRSRELYDVIKNEFIVVEESFGIKISDMEYASLIDLFELQYGTALAK
jgi:transcriptional regulator with AAA-type ATPase domain/transcriptional regulatory protein LevR